jgi:hypothetical protein
MNSGTRNSGRLEDLAALAITSFADMKRGQNYQKRMNSLTFAHLEFEFGMHTLRVLCVS